jgi:thiol-disulfide isomerase/thioredoxin
MSGKTAGHGATSRAILVTVLAALAGFAAVYVTLGGRDNARPSSTTAAPVPASASTTREDKLNTGEMAAFVFKKEPEALAEVSFSDGKGQPRTLKDWQSRVVLLNLWATWCAPCRKEMPALAALQREFGSKDFEVVALAVDRAGADAAQKFLTSIKATDLALYIDPTARAGTALKAAGMPTTLLIDRQGREIGRLTGAAEWDSSDAKRLIRAFLK